MLSMCISEKHIYLLFSQICHKNEVLFIAVTQWSILLQHICLEFKTKTQKTKTDIFMLEMSGKKSLSCLCIPQFTYSYKNTWCIIICFSLI